MHANARLGLQRVISREDAKNAKKSPDLTSRIRQRCCTFLHFSVAHPRREPGPRPPACWSILTPDMSFFSKQFIDVIQWTEPGDGTLAYRYPMEDMEIQNGGKLTVRDSQMAVFVNEGKVADVFGPGLYTLNTQTLPILTYLKNWDKAF